MRYNNFMIDGRLRGIRTSRVSRKQVVCQRSGTGYTVVVSGVRTPLYTVCGAYSLHSQVPLRRRRRRREYDVDDTITISKHATACWILRITSAWGGQQGVYVEEEEEEEEEVKKEATGCTRVPVSTSFPLRPTLPRSVSTLRPLCRWKGWQG